MAPTYETPWGHLHIWHSQQKDWLSHGWEIPFALLLPRGVRTFLLKEENDGLESGLQDRAGATGKRAPAERDLVNPKLILVRSCL